MKLLLFGEIGSGKSFIGDLLAREFGLHYHDADTDLPPEIAGAIRRHEPLTDAMRDAFVDRIEARIAVLSSAHSRFVIAQALFRNRHRARLLAAFPGLTFVWVQSPSAQIERRLQMRTGHLATTYYASLVNPFFEAPTVPHHVITNEDDLDQLREQLVRLVCAPAGKPSSALRP